MKLGVYSPPCRRRKKSHKAFKKLLTIVIVWAAIIAAYGLVGHP